jgi:hypothetical protein
LLSKLADRMSALRPPEKRQVVLTS